MASFALLLQWPYSRSYQHFTAQPLESIAHAKDKRTLRSSIADFQTGKFEELTGIRTNVSRMVLEISTSPNNTGFFELFASRYNHQGDFQADFLPSPQTQLFFTSQIPTSSII